MKRALVLIDKQKDYFAGGKNELFRPIEAAENAKELLAYFRQTKLDILHIRHISTGEKASFFWPVQRGRDTSLFCRRPMSGLLLNMSRFVLIRA
jgi:nicotinamidase-related amidase